MYQSQRYINSFILRWNGQIAVSELLFACVETSLVRTIVIKTCLLVMMMSVLFFMQMKLEPNLVPLIENETYKVWAEDSFWNRGKPNSKMG